MAILKCMVCGGELELNGDLSVGKCKYCESVITIPRQLEKRENLYNRATFLRQNSQFDKAMDVYEEILKEDNQDAEAHWGIVLSKFGIAYVVDPKTQAYIPTCHRIQFDSILADPDYLAALEFGAYDAKGVYERQARQIDGILGNYTRIAKNEPPYDIFICYKESDDFGIRTEDSVIAQDLYYQLEKQGYKVFFARKTLEGKLGEEYEPIIFAALTSAKIMIVLGTKASHFEAVWVKNEWGRFYQMVGTVEGKILIPAYKGMSPYELPAQLQSFQAQDMAKLGFMQDLLDGIEKVLKRNEGGGTEEPWKGGGYSSGLDSLERRLENAQTFLRLDKYDSAMEVYQTVTKDYPEDYRGWWGLIVCRTENFAQLLQETRDINQWFGFVKKLANPEAYAEKEKIFLDYSRKLAQKAAADEREEIRKHGDENLKSAQKLQQDNERVMQERGQYLSRKKEEREGLEMRREEAVRNLSECNSKLKRIDIKKIVLSVILGMLLIGIVCISSSSNQQMAIYGFELVIVLWVGFFVAWNSKRKKYNESWKESKQIIEAVTVQIKQQNHVDSTLQGYDEKIRKNKECLERLSKDTANCYQYLGLEEEQVTAYWFAKICEGFQIRRPYDEVVERYRELALGEGK